MILLVDIGNSSLKWAWLDDGRFRSGGVLARAGQETRDLARAAWAEAEQPERVLVANVAGDRVRRSLTAWMTRHWKVTPEFPVAQAAACGVQNGYQEPAGLGIDRWAAMLAARQLVRGPVCVVDCGTAITLDVLDAKGVHRGGLITPGVALMRQALSQGAEGIPEFSSEEPLQAEASLLATNTTNAVFGGTLYAAVALIDRVTADLRAELGARMALVITGGDAPDIMPLLANKPRHVPDLVLRGLARLAESEQAASEGKRRKRGARSGREHEPLDLAAT